MQFLQNQFNDSMLKDHTRANSQPNWHWNTIQKLSKTSATLKIAKKVKGMCCVQKAWDEHMEG